MKKTLVTLIGTVLAVSAMAQGTLNVGNSSSGFRSPIYGPQAGNPAQSLTGAGPLSTPAGATAYTGALLSGTGYTFAVYYGAASVIDPSALTLLASATFRTSTGSGALPAGLITTITDVVVPGVAAGAQAKLQVRVWDNAGGTINSYDNAITRGQSALFLSSPLGGTTTAGPVITPSMTGFESFNIYTVPEPSTFVLAGLGAASLLIFRRRK